MKLFFLSVLGLYILYYVGNIIYDLYFLKEKTAIVEESFNDLIIVDDDSGSAKEHTIDEVQEFSSPSQFTIDDDILIQEKFGLINENEFSEENLSEYEKLYNYEKGLEENSLILYRNEMEESNEKKPPGLTSEEFNDIYKTTSAVNVSFEKGIREYSFDILQTEQV